MERELLFVNLVNITIAGEGSILIAKKVNNAVDLASLL